jgi:hypothetical protein
MTSSIFYYGHALFCLPLKNSFLLSKPERAGRRGQRKLNLSSSIFAKSCATDDLFYAIRWANSRRALYITIKWDSKAIPKEIVQY